MKGIKQLARHLDISIGTVSRALNGKPDVNPETRKRVLAAAEAFGYAPNQSGRSLRQGTTNAIGFMIELSADTNASSDDFFMGVFDGVQTVLSRHKLDLVVFPCPADQRPVEYLQRIVGRRLVDAMIISATLRNDARIEFLKKAGIPFIALGRSNSGGDLRWIDLDFEGVASGSVDRLVEHGHKRIAIAIPADDINLGHVFHDGYRAALERHDIAYDPALVYRQERIVEGGHGLAARIAATDNPPTAIMLSTEVLAPSLYRGLEGHGMVPGKDIAVIGFRDNPRARYLTPSLTCHSFSLSALGEAVAETLLADMPAYAKNYPGKATNKIWPLTFLPGESDDFVLPH
ncbi:MAG: transcriptional regulator, LacI family [Rhizobium sp.]|nr:transcriptional regulator, LacI family [Rhizobium sp.]